MAQVATAPATNTNSRTSTDLGLVMRILLDMDGVMADFVGGAMWLHNKPWPFVGDHVGNKAWDILKAWGMSPVDFWGPMGRTFWAGLEKTKEADATMALLKDMAGVENICFLTSPCLTEGCMEGKRDWVHKHFPDVPLLIASHSMTGLAAKPFCAHNEAWLIDDYHENAWKFSLAGGNAFLFPRPWNDCWRDEHEAVKLLRDQLESWEALQWGVSR